MGEKKKKKEEEGCRVKVHIRLKQCDEKEVSKYNIFSDATQLHIPNPEGRLELDRWYRYDHIYSTLASNKEVYKLSAYDLVESALKGLNTAIFAYGQTGSGKTHTLMSKDGVTAHMVSHLFNRIWRSSHLDYKVTCSYYQIYNERIYDLLNPHNEAECHIREDGKGEVYVENITDVLCETPMDVYELINIGRRSLVIGETKMSRLSCRSHAVCRLSIEKRKKLPRMKKRSMQETFSFHTPENNSLQVPDVHIGDVEDGLNNSPIDFRTIPFNKVDLKKRHSIAVSKATENRKSPRTSPRSPSLIPSRARSPSLSPGLPRARSNSVKIQPRKNSEEKRKLSESETNGVGRHENHQRSPTFILSKIPTISPVLERSRSNSVKSNVRQNGTKSASPTLTPSTKKNHKRSCTPPERKSDEELLTMSDTIGLDNVKRLNDLYVSNMSTNNADVINYNAEDSFTFSECSIEDYESSNYLEVENGHDVFDGHDSDIIDEDDDDFDGDIQIFKSRISIIDLAGSERLGDTSNMDGERLKEAQNINLSLLELGNVISALASGKKKHIPYRNSTLTRVLQDSLGGNCRTKFLLCISSKLIDANETKCTLEFGQKLTKVHTKPRLNLDIDYKRKFEQLSEQLKHKETDYACVRNEMSDMVNEYQLKMEENGDKSCDQLVAMDTLQEELKRAQEELEESRRMVDTLQQSLLDKDSVIELKDEQLLRLQVELDSLVENLKDTSSSKNIGTCDSSTNTSVENQWNRHSPFCFDDSGIENIHDEDNAIPLLLSEKRIDRDNAIPVLLSEKTIDCDKAHPVLLSEKTIDCDNTIPVLLSEKTIDCDNPIPILLSEKKKDCDNAIPVLLSEKTIDCDMRSYDSPFAISTVDDGLVDSSKGDGAMMDGKTIEQKNLELYSLVNGSGREVLTREDDTFILHISDHTDNHYYNDNNNIEDNNNYNKNNSAKMFDGNKNYNNNCNNLKSNNNIIINHSNNINKTDNNNNSNNDNNNSDNNSNNNNNNDNNNKNNAMEDSTIFESCMNFPSNDRETIEYTPVQRKITPFKEKNEAKLNIPKQVNRGILNNSNGDILNNTNGDILNNTNGDILNHVNTDTFNEKDSSPPQRVIVGQIDCIPATEVPVSSSTPININTLNKEQKGITSNHVINTMSLRNGNKTTDFIENRISVSHVYSNVINDVTPCLSNNKVPNGNNSGFVNSEGIDWLTDESREAYRRAKLHGSLNTFQYSPEKNIWTNEVATNTVKDDVNDDIKSVIETADVATNTYINTDLHAYIHHEVEEYPDDFFDDLMDTCQSGGSSYEDDRIPARFVIGTPIVPVSLYNDGHATTANGFTVHTADVATNTDSNDQVVVGNVVETTDMSTNTDNVVKTSDVATNNVIETSDAATNNVIETSDAAITVSITDYTAAGSVVETSSTSTSTNGIDEMSEFVKNYVIDTSDDVTNNVSESSDVITFNVIETSDVATNNDIETSDVATNINKNDLPFIEDTIVTSDTSTSMSDNAIETLDSATSTCNLTPSTSPIIVTFLQNPSPRHQSNPQTPSRTSILCEDWFTPSQLSPNKISTDSSGVTNMQPPCYRSDVMRAAILVELSTLKCLYEHYEDVSTNLLATGTNDNEPSQPTINEKREFPLVNDGISNVILEIFSVLPGLFGENRRSVIDTPTGTDEKRLSMNSYKMAPVVSKYTCAESHVVHMHGYFTKRKQTAERELRNIANDVSNSDNNNNGGLSDDIVTELNVIETLIDKISDRSSSLTLNNEKLLTLLNTVLSNHTWTACMFALNKIHHIEPNDELVSPVVEEPGIDKLNSSPALLRAVDHHGDAKNGEKKRKPFLTRLLCMPTKSSKSKKQRDSVYYSTDV